MATALYNDQQTAAATTIVVAAYNSLDRSRATYQCGGSNDQIVIQTALDNLPSDGGEVVLLDGTYYIEASIEFDSYQKMRGGGDGTILTTRTNSTKIITATGTSGDEKVGIVISSMRIDGDLGGATSITGIEFSYCDYSDIAYCTIRDCDSYGVNIQYSDYNSCHHNKFISNLDSISVHLSSVFNKISSNILISNRIGISIGSNNNDVIDNTIRLSDRHGMYITGDYNLISINRISESSQESDDSYDNIQLGGDYNTITGNVIKQGSQTNKPTYGIDIGTTVKYNVIQNNDLSESGKTANIRAPTKPNIVRNNNIDITSEVDYAYVKNTYGGDLVAGDVVVLKAVAAGNEITCTEVEGDQRVLGMLAENIADDGWGHVQVLGKTIVLKVNGTADISIGDLICCFSTEKIGMKAAAGTMAFAMALEAYTTNDSSGVIDALLIVPRQAI